MIKRFFRVFICLSILLVIAFQQSACTIIEDMLERRNQEYEKRVLFCKQYMQSMPVDEEGYEISYEEGIETCYYANMERMILDDGETVINFEMGFGLYLEYKGEKIRIDISSSASPHYVRHTNNKGLYSEQKTVKIALNTVILDESYIELPISGGEM